MPAQKRFLSIAFLTILLIAGCVSDLKVSAPTPSASPTQETTISRSSVNWMGHWHLEDMRETLVREVAQQFEFEHPEIDVNMKFHEEIVGAHSKPVTAKYIADMIRSGKLDWDVIWLDDNIYQMVANELGDPQWAEHYLVNFEEIEGFATCQKPFITTDPTYRNQTGGTLIGPYVEGYYNALYYNSKVAKQIGIEITHENMTFDDLLGYVEAVHNYNQTHEEKIPAFYEARDWTSLEIVFQSLVKSELGNFEAARNEAVSDAKLAAILKTFQAFEQLGKFDPLISTHAENVWFETRDLVLEDKALFYVNGTWMYSHWHSLDHEATNKMIPVELPVFQPVDYYLGGYIPTWAVLDDAPNRDNAIKLLMFWCQPEVAEKWVRYNKNPTGILGNLSASDIGADPFEEFQSYITSRYGANVHYSANAGYLLGPKNVLLQEDIFVLLRQLLTGQISAQAAYDQLTAKMDNGQELIVRYGKAKS